MEEIRFTLTHDDFWHFLLHAFSRPRRTRRRMVLVCVITILAIIYAISISGGALPVQFPLFSVLLLLVVLFVVLFGLVFLVLWLGAARAGKLMEKRGMYVLTISAQGVQQSNALSDSRTSWRALQEIAEDKHYIYFRLENPGPVFTAFLIPKRAFESPQQAESFVERARAYWREHSGQITAQS